MDGLLDRFKRAAFEQGKRLAQNPQFMRMMTDPRVMNAFAKAIELPAKVRAQLDTQCVRFARRVGLATESEMAALRTHFHSLEQALVELKHRVTGRKER